MPSSRGIFPIQGSKLRLLHFLHLADWFCATSATWESNFITDSPNFARFRLGDAPQPPGGRGTRGCLQASV